MSDPAPPSARDPPGEDDPHEEDEAALAARCATALHLPPGGLAEFVKYLVAKHLALVHKKDADDATVDAHWNGSKDVRVSMYTQLIEETEQADAALEACDADDADEGKQADAGPP